MKRTCALLAIVGALAILTVGFMSAKDKPADKNGDANSDRQADKEAIQQTMKGFTAAFEKGDASAAAGFLTSGAELIPESAEPIRGRDAVEKALKEHFAKNPRVKVTLEVEAVRFTSKDTAIEEGTIKVVPEKGDASNNRYSVLLVREDGKWLLGYIKEWPDDNADLKDLDWLIGTWTAKRGDAEVRTTYEWFGNKSFIKAQFTVREKDKTITGMQMIGVDPSSGDLRTWTFENDGGFGEGKCTRDGKKWVFETLTTLADGGVLEAQNILIQVDKNTLTWQPTNLTVDGEQFGNLPPVKVTRLVTKD